MAGQTPQGLHVLLVEDHPDVAASTAMILEYFGYEVAVACDGPAALEAVRLQEPDVALLDIGLPKMDGCEVARQLRGMCHEKLVLIGVSGYGGAEQEERCAAAGIEMLLLKPV